MSTQLTVGPDKVTVARQWSLVRATAGNLNDTAGITYTGTTLANGTGAGNANVTYQLQGTTIAASGTLTINLQSLTDPDYGGAVSFSRIKRLYIGHNSTSTASAFQVGSAGVQNPTSAPVLTQTATGGGLSDGTYTVGYTFTDGTNETILSPTASITLNGGGASQEINVGAITLPSGATGIRYYLSLASTGTLVGRSVTTGTGGAVALTALATTTSAPPPQSNGLLTGPASLFGGNQAGLMKVNNGCCWYLGTDPGATGYVISAPNTNLLITNLDGTNAALVDIQFDGCNA